MRILAYVLTLFVFFYNLVVFLNMLADVANDQEETEESYFEYTTDTPAGFSNWASNPTEDTMRVELYDQGLEMTLGSYALPAGWSLVQDIRTAPYQENYESFTLYFEGPEGEIIRSLGFREYNRLAAPTSFDQVWRKTVESALKRGSDILTLDSLKPVKVSQPLTARESRLPEITYPQPYEASLMWCHEGRLFLGVVRVTDWKTDESPVNYATGRVVLAPLGKRTPALKTEAQIVASFRPNPNFEQHVRRLSGSPEADNALAMSSDNSVGL